MLPVGIGCPFSQALYDDISRRTQQYDMVEQGKKLPHILCASTQEQHITVLGGQEVLDSVFAPYPIPIHCYWRCTGTSIVVGLYPLRELVAVRIYSLISACGQLGDDRGLAGSRHPRQ